MVISSAGSTRTANRRQSLESTSGLRLWDFAYWQITTRNAISEAVSTVQEMNDLLRTTIAELTAFIFGLRNSMSSWQPKATQRPTELAENSTPHVVTTGVTRGEGINNPGFVDFDTELGYMEHRHADGIRQEAGKFSESAQGDFRIFKVAIECFYLSL